MKRRLAGWVGAVLGVGMLFFAGAGNLKASVPPRTSDDDRVYYEIFVRSFQDSNGDGIGDLKGITSRLDYLKDLGIGGIWLTPIFASPSYHGYDATDYLAIQPEYGTLADFEELLTAAHERGIRVLLDFAINHTSHEHPWFTERPGWYVWRDRDPGWPGPSRWYPEDGQVFYGFFGPHMPDLNFADATLVAEIRRIARYWLDQGVDGFRLDAARYYIEGPRGEPDTPATHALISELGTTLKASHPGMTLVGEIWAGMDVIAPYVESRHELNQAFHFPLSGGLLTSLGNLKAADFSSALRQSTRKRLAPEAMAPFLTNHDMTRIASQLGRHMPRESVEARLRLAAATLLSQPGTPYLYYGEEIGMTNGSRHLPGRQGDIDKRTPMQWTREAHHGFTDAGVAPWSPFSSDDPHLTVEEQSGHSGSLLETYRSLIRLRREHGALGATSPVHVLSDPNAQVSAYVRGDPSKGKAVLVLLNFGDTKVDGLTLNVGGGQPHVIWGKVSVSRKDAGQVTVSGLDRSSAVWVEI